MKKRILLFCALITIGFVSVAQTPAAAVNKGTAESIYTALKPVDGLAYVFSSKKEMDASVPGKKSKVLAEIKKNEADAEKVKTLRWELWRIENATIMDARINK